MNASISLKGATAAAFALAIALAIAACGDDTPVGLGSPCGDGFCLGTEDQFNCPRDCPYECIPGEQRCAENALLTCRLDGLSESAEFCQPDEVCTTSGCEPSPGLTPDVGVDADIGPDLAMDAGDTTDDLDADPDSDVDDLTADAPDDTSAEMAD